MSFLPAPCLDEDVTYNESDIKNIATMIGVRLVTQILEEACTIASATQRLGWPWTSVLAVLKDLKTGNVSKPRDALLSLLQGEIFNDTGELATSTPNKGETMNIKHENSLIGQGDEETDASHIKRNISPSIFINQLFNLSNVDDEDEEIEQDKTEMIIEPDNERPDINCENIEPDDERPEIMCEIMNHLFHGAVDIAADEQVNVVEIDALSDTQENIVEIPLEEVVIFNEDDESDLKEKIREIHYAFIQEAYDTCGLSTVQCFLDKDNESSDEYVAADTNIIIEELDDGDASVRQAKTEDEEKEEKLEAARYENAFLSLNRDYEKCSDDGNPVLEDPKESMDMQEVKLFPSSEDSSACKEDEGQNLAATSGVSGVSGKSRSSLVSRCKTHGARLLACLRGWWHRKTPGKRKQTKTAGSIRGMCPLSPGARRLAASVLDHRELYSPTPKRGLPLKFNTVNESVVKSTQWKEYTYELAKTTDECEKNLPGII